MKKDTLRAVVTALIVLAIYHLVVFLIPFAKTPVFWISYGFSLAAFAVAAMSIYIAFCKNPDARSKFYGFPIARIGLIYGATQLVVSLVFMALGCWTPWWIAVLVYAIGLGAALLGLIDLVNQAGATVVGCGIAVEKSFQPGGKRLRDMGVRVESLARVSKLDDGVLEFEQE